MLRVYVHVWGIFISLALTLHSRTASIGQVYSEYHPGSLSHFCASASEIHTSPELGIVSNLGWYAWDGKPGYEAR